ncbi:MAG: hypothetical protein HYV67_01945 [Candidatus Taylorbacteria bacterium]|nr:hypothetical protein [Candidatus Taylorbacteria bacterium]
MFNYLEQLRKKPLAYRKRVLLFTTAVITGVIFIVWLSTFDLNLKVSDADSAALAKQLRPIDEVKTNIVSFIDSVKKISADIFGYK